MRILITDDAAFMRNMLKDILSKLGHEIIAEASNGIEALEQYIKYKPDVVTMDITMPDCDGIRSVTNIIAYDKNAKIIMVSAMGQKAMVVDAIKAGASDFIVKPFNPASIARAFEKIATK